MGIKFLILLSGFLLLPMDHCFSEEKGLQKNNKIIVVCEDDGAYCKYYTLDGIFRNERKCNVTLLDDGQSSMTCYEYGSDNELIKVVFVLVYKNVVGRTVRETFEDGVLISRETYRDQKKVSMPIKNGIIIDEEIYEKQPAPPFLKGMKMMFDKRKNNQTYKKEIQKKKQKRFKDL